MSVIIRRKSAQIYRLFAICPGGFDEILKQEIESLGVRSTQHYAGGVEFEGNLELSYRACLQLRTVSRVLLLLGENKKVFSEDALYLAIKEIEWARVFAPNCTFAVYLTETQSKSKKPMKNAQYWALKAKDAIADHFNDRFGSRPDVDRKDPDITIRLHLHDSILKIYLDLSGNSLHERGYRSQTGSAPIKENLAAGLLHLANWPELAKSKTALYDPFCGSGTFLIEAAMMATQTPAGSLRTRFGFFAWKDHQPRIFEKVQAELAEKVITDREALPTIYGSDVNPEMVEIARENVERAGMSHLIQLSVAPFEDSTPPEPKGMIITNPPYGVRIGEVQEWIPLYQKIGSTLKHQYSGWKAGVIASEKELFHAISLKPSKKWAINNGGLKSQFAIYDLY